MDVHTRRMVAFDTAFWNSRFRTTGSKRNLKGNYAKRRKQRKKRVRGSDKPIFPNRNWTQTLSVKTDFFLRVVFDKMVGTK